MLRQDGDARPRRADARAFEALSGRVGQPASVETGANGLNDRRIASVAA